tara:strand:- start:297 stop:398 length:102 start_codon:yes stop_codon:yes gene_type:complete
MGYFIKNIMVYGLIALVIWMLYLAIKGFQNKDK